MNGARRIRAAETQAGNGRARVLALGANVQAED
jgi:hypothetical protein